ncbi:MAG: RNA pseudouridine synthase [Acidobacteriota bacterium]
MLTAVELPSPPGAGAYLAVDKRSGIAVHGPGGLLGALRESLGEEGRGLALVHRLDKETSGVLLLARTAEALSAAHAAWPTQVVKTYLAVTRGVPHPPEGRVDAPLLEHRTSRPDLLKRAVKAAYGPSRAGHLLAGRRVLAIQPLPPPGRTAVHPAGRHAATRYRVLEDRGGTALVELIPETGRMHQLRIHLVHLGTPLLGDTAYDPGRAEGDPPALLHAARLVWTDPPGMPPGTVWVWEAARPAQAPPGP